MSLPVETNAMSPDDAGDRALKRFRLLQPALEDGVPITTLAKAVRVSERTLRRWVQRHREHGMAGLARLPRCDRSRRRRVSADMVALIEGLALERPRRSVAAVYRLVREAASREGLPVPSYATVHAIIGRMDPALLVLAHDGAKAYTHRFDLLHRREATRPNEIWQADHTELDILVFDETGAVLRPWLTVIIDNHSRAIAAYRLSTRAPSALQTALALRNAIWRKGEPGWTICGIPEVFYTDHGSDFTSRHIEQVCAELKMRLIFSQVGQPRGRGRIERYFGKLNTCCLVELPGYLAPNGTPAKPGMTLAQLDAVLRRFIVETHNHTPHSATGEAPETRWSRGGFLPRMPASLEQLDLLLLTVARPRQVHRDGIRFQSLRYIDTTLAAFAGETVTIRYDPADMAEIRVFRRGEFLCRAVCQELAGETVSLKDILRARRDRRRALRDTIKSRRSLVDQLLVRPTVTTPVLATAPAVAPALAGAPSLKRYRNE